MLRTLLGLSDRNQIKLGLGVGVKKEGFSAYVPSTQQKQGMLKLGLCSRAGRGVWWGLWVWFHSLSLLAPASGWNMDVGGLFLLRFLEQPNSSKSKRSPASLPTMSVRQS